MPKKKAERTIDERVAEVFAVPEPTEEPVSGFVQVSGDVTVLRAKPPAVIFDYDVDAAVEWHAEAGEILELVRAGNVVSPSRVSACLSRAVGLVPR